MKIEDFLPRELVISNLQSKTKRDCLKEMCHRTARMYTTLDQEELVAALMARESLQPTALGESIAVPHVFNKQFKQFVIAVARSGMGLDFDAPDKKPVHAIFLLIMPEGLPDQHLALLSRLGRLVDRKDFLARFTAAEDGEALYEEIITMDSECP